MYEETAQLRTRPAGDRGIKWEMPQRLFPYSQFIEEGGAFAYLNLELEVTIPDKYSGQICTSQFAYKCGFEVESLVLHARSITP